MCDQCAAAGVPFFFKQHGEWLSTRDDAASGNPISYGKHKRHVFEPDTAHEEFLYRVGKISAGRLLDGIEHNAFPERP